MNITRSSLTTLLSVAATVSLFVVGNTAFAATPPLQTNRPSNATPGAKPYPPKAPPTSSSSGIQPQVGSYQKYVPPSSIPIAIFSLTSTGAPIAYQYTTTVPFNTYTQNVLPNEWIASWNMNALEAGALAVKMYGWYHEDYQWKFPQYNAALDNSTRSQVYKAGSAMSSTNTALSNEYSNVIVTGSGYVFETAFQAGPYSSQSSGGYTMYQNGTEWYAVNDGWSPNQMVSFYYSGDSAFVRSEYQPCPCPVS